MCFVNIVLLLFQLFLSTVFCSETFYKIYESEKNAKIRGIANNEPLLAIVTEKDIVFGSVRDDFKFTEKKKSKLTRNLTGNNELLEFKFIKNDTVIICNEMQCSICNSSSLNGKCTTIASFAIKSVSAESTNEMLFLRVVYERNDASFYSYKLDTYERIGQKYDDAENEYKSLYSFSHGGYLYFVSEVKRHNLDLCLKSQSNSAQSNNDIVITQICNNDQSNKIFSHIEITLSCGKEADTNTSYSKNKTIHRNIYNNNVTGITYLSKENQLLIAIQDSSTFSFMCKLNISDIEAEFCKTWNYCQNDYSSNILNDTYKKCNIKSWDTKVCYKYSNAYDQYATCESLVNSSYRCGTSLSKHDKYKWMESYAILFGEIDQQEYYTALYGNLISSSSQLYYFIDKNTIKKEAKDGKHFLKGLPINNLKKITPWDSKNGIIYVDPVKNNAASSFAEIYFKNVFCINAECVDILHSKNVKCHFCGIQNTSSSTCKHYAKNETYCGPIWQKATEFYFWYPETVNVIEENNFKIINDGDEILNVRCDITDFQDCTPDIDNRLAAHFTAALPLNNLVSRRIVIAVVAISFFACIILASILYLFNQHMKRLKKNRSINGNTKLDKERSPYLYLLGQHPKQHSYVNTQISAKKVTLLKELGSGNFGIVYLGIYKDGNETKKVAVKTFKCSKADVIKEIESLSSCQHDNIVSFIAWMEINNEMYIILEYMHGGDLHSYLRNPKNILTVSTIFSYIFQILDAMIYLSQNKILHRDLAARNCLLNDTHEILKISDFGLARKMDVNYEYRPENERELPYRWLPLEALRNEKFTVKGDIWSFAVLIWEIFERGTLPYKNLKSSAALLNFLESGERLYQPQHCREKLFEIMKKCWNEIPEERPTFKILQPEIQQLYDKLKTEDERNMKTEVHEYVNQTKTSQ